MNNMNKLIKGIGVFLLYIFIPMLLPSITTTNTKELIVTIFGMFLLLLFFIFIYKEDIIKDIKALKSDGLKILGKSIMYFAVLLVGLIVVSSILFIVYPNFEYTNSTIISALLKENYLVMIIYVFIITMMIEQIVFRKVFKDIIGNKYFFVIFSGLIYGIFQVGYNISSINDILSIISFTFAGSILSLSYEKTNNITTPCLVYLFYNLFILISSMF